MIFPKARPAWALPHRKFNFPFLVSLFILSLLLLSCTSAQTAKDAASLNPLPQDTGKAGLELMLRRLSTTGRLLHTTAHPDDEDGGMITVESRGKGETVVLLTLNRGEGGQNKVGSNLFDVLGVLRSLELTASDRYYDVEQRFTRVADFGFSKSQDETFEKWHGHDPALGDIVRVIRTFVPMFSYHVSKAVPMMGTATTKPLELSLTRLFAPLPIPSAFRSRSPKVSCPGRPRSFISIAFAPSAATIARQTATP